MNKVVLLLIALVLLLGGMAFFLFSSDGGAQEVIDLGLATVPEVSESRREASTLTDVGAAEERPAPAPESSRSTLTGAEPRTAAAPEAPRTGFVRGRVADALRRPVEGALVLLTDQGARSRRPIDSEWFRQRYGHAIREARTDAKGFFEFEEMDPGPLRVAVRADGFAPFDENEAILPSASNLDLGVLELQPGIRLAGRVLTQDGAPVAAAEVSLLAAAAEWKAGEEGVLVAASGPDGTFTVDQLAPGPWRLRVSSPEHPDRIVEGLEERPGTTVEVEVRLEEGSTIGGWVAGAEEDAGLVVVGTPASTQATRSAGVAVGVREVAVGGDGAFRLAGLLADAEYELRVKRGDGAGSRKETWLSDPVSARAPSTDVVLELHALGTVRFRLVDAQTEAPVKSFTLHMGFSDGSQRWTRYLNAATGDYAVGDDGTVTVQGVPARGTSAQIAFKIQSYGRRVEQRSGLAVPPNEVLDLGDIPLTSLSEVVVRVVDAETGEPLDGAVAYASRAGAARAPDLFGPGADGSFTAPRSSAGTGANGAARLPVEQGLYSFWATHSGFAPCEPASFAVPRAEEIVLELGRGGAVTVHVADSAGQPTAAATVIHTEVFPDGYARDRQSGERTGVTDRDGVVVFERLAAGLHRFSLKVAPPAKAPTPVEVVVTDGGELTVNLGSPGAFALEGIVRESGTPLVGASVWLENGTTRRAKRMLLGPGTRDPSTRTDAEGKYRLADVPLGDWVLVVGHATRAMESEYVLGFEEPGLYEYDVDLTATRIDGRVVDESGRPLEGISIAVRPAEAARNLRNVTFVRGSTMTDAASIESATKSGADGRFQLRGLQAQRDLVVIGRGEMVQTRKSDVFHLEPDGHASVELVLPLAGELEVTVYVQGELGRGCGVHASYRGPNRGVAENHNVVTDDEGRVLLTGLVPGPWRIRVSPVDVELDEPVSREVEVEGGRRAELTFEVP